MELSNLDEDHARRYRRSAVALLALAGFSLLGVFVGLYNSSPFITLYSLLLTGIFLFSAFFTGGVGLSVVARQGARTVYRRETEQQVPPYMTDFPEEDHPPERGR